MSSTPTDTLSPEQQRQQYEHIGQYQLSKTRAFGKLILLGEHFVVYHVPALVGAVQLYTDCQVEIDNADGKTGVSVQDYRPAVPQYKTKKAQEGQHAIQLVLDHLKVDTKQQHVRLTFGGTLTCCSGIGASAAQVVSLARALQYELPLPLSEDEINQAGYEGEKGYHGTPSGIDNTAATFGGLLKFQRHPEGQPPSFTKFKLSSPIRIVYASTGITASTTEVVGDVKRLKDKDPAWFDNLLQQYLKLAEQAETALLNNDMAELGPLLTQNHQLLQQLTVSCPELDALVECAMQAGAMGAKMSGTGRGGLVLALTPTVELQDQVATALEQHGAPQVWKTQLA